MRKRLFAALMCLCLIVSLLPAAALAADEDGVSISIGGYYDVLGSKEHPVYATTDAATGEINPILDENFDPTTGTWNIKWDGETLTLNGATIIYDEGVNSRAAISCTGNLKIELMGANTVTGRSCGIDSNGDITISGSGTLAVIGGDVSENGYASYGIYAGGNVTVEGANVTATGGNIDDDSYGIYAGGEVTVEGATVTASGGDVSENGYASYGIYADGDVTVEDADADVTATGGKAGVYSYGIRAYEGSVTISGGTVEATGGEAGDDSCGICADDGSVNISGGTVEATGGEAGGSSYGIYGTYNTFLGEGGKTGVTITGGNVTATGGTVSSDEAVSCGIYGSSGGVPTGISISGGTVTATGGEVTGGAKSYGLCGSSLNAGVILSGGTVTAWGRTKAVGDNNSNYNYRIAPAATVAEVKVMAGENKDGSDASEVTEYEDLKNKYIKITITLPEHEIYVGGVGLSGSEDEPDYAKTDNDGKVTTDGASADNYNIKWDGSTLTLNNAKITQGAYESAAIYTWLSSYDPDYSVYIVLEGDNTVTGPSNTQDGWSCGIRGEENTMFTISGGGTLNVTGGTATFDDDAASYGIDAFEIKITGGEVTAEGGSAEAGSNDAESYGINAFEIKITDGEVTAKGGSATANGEGADACSEGINAVDVTISGGKVTATGGPATSDSYDAESYGIDAQYVQITGGEVTAEGGSATANGEGADACSEGINAGYVTISGGEVTATGRDAAIATYNSVVINPEDGLSIAVKAGASVNDTVSIDIPDDGDITDLISDAKYFHSTGLSGPGPEPPTNYDIYVGGIGLSVGANGEPAYAVNDGSGSVTADGADESNYNVKWDGTALTLNGVNVTAGHKFEYDSYDKTKAAAAIYCENGLTIVLNGENTVTGPDCTDEIAFSFGVYAGGDITVSGSGSLNAAGGDNGISTGVMSFDGGVTFSGGTVTARGGAGQNSVGILAASRVIVNSGTVTAAGADNANSVGIAAAGLTVNGGELTAEGGSFTGASDTRVSYGLALHNTASGTNSAGTMAASANGSADVLITGGTVTITGATGSMDLNRGTVVIDPAAVTQIRAWSGVDAQTAPEIDGSPFSTSTDVTKSVDSDLYFHSEVASDDPDPDPDPDWPWNPGGGTGTRYVTLTFEPRGGSELDKLRVPAGTTVDLTEYLSERSGFDFAGWYPDEDFTGSIDEIYMDKDKTVYAGWEPFDDADSGDWFYDCVVYVYENGLMDGVSDARFAPDGTVTRAQLVTILWRLDGGPAVNYLLPFTDVAEGEWYTEAVRWAASEGIVNGVSDTEFAPGADVTREQFAAILYRYAQYKGYDVSIGESTNILSFTDFDTVSEYAVSALQWACGEGIITGVTESTLVPQGTATRAQAAAMLQRFCENVK